jgi:hypothetical protein
MQSLGTGTQSASGLSAAFSTRPDSYLRKPGIGTDRQLGGGEKGIYKTSEIGPFDDPISRFEDNEEDDININIDIDFDDLNIDIGNIDGARSAVDSLSRIGTKAQSNQMNAMGIGSYAGAGGPIGNNVSEGLSAEHLIEGFIREVLLENSPARSMSFSPYATFNKGPGSYQSSLYLGTSKDNKRMKPFKQRSVTAQDMNSAGGGIQRRYDRRPRTGDPKAWVGGRAGDLMRNAIHPESDDSHVISQSEKREHGIGLSTWEMFQQTQTDKDEQFVKRRRNEENALKSKK